jgi:hypothetical protein
MEWQQLELCPPPENHLLLHAPLLLNAPARFLHQNRPRLPHNFSVSDKIHQQLHTMKLTAATLILASSSVKGQTATLEPGNFSEGLTIKE